MMTHSDTIFDSALSPVDDAGSYTRQAGFDRPVWHTLPKAHRPHLARRMAWHRATRTGGSRFAKGGTVGHGWYAVDLNPSTDDGIELVYVQAPTFTALSRMLSITTTGLKPRAFRVAACELDPSRDECFPEETQTPETVTLIRSRFRRQQKKQTHGQ